MIFHRGKHFARLEIGKLHFHVYAGPRARFYRVAASVGWNGESEIGYTHKIRLEIK